MKQRKRINHVSAYDLYKQVSDRSKPRRMIDRCGQLEFKLKVHGKLTKEERSELSELHTELGEYHANK